MIAASIDSIYKGERRKRLVLAYVVLCVCAVEALIALNNGTMEET